MSSASSTKTMAKGKNKNSWFTRNYRDTKFHLASGAAAGLTISAPGYPFEVHREVFAASSLVLVAMFGQFMVKWPLLIVVP